MRVLVKLLGTLPSYYAGSYTAAGIELDLPAGATIEHLVGFLGLPKNCVAVATINNMLAKAHDPIQDQATVKLMQVLAGG